MSIALRDVRGGVALLDTATTRFISLGDHWEANRTLLAIGESGRAVDAQALVEFFEGLKSIDELARARALADPGVERP